MEPSQHPQCNLESLVMAQHHILLCRLSKLWQKRVGQSPCLSSRYESKSLFVLGQLGFALLHHGNEQSGSQTCFLGIQLCRVSSESLRFDPHCCRCRIDLAERPEKPLHNLLPDSLRLRYHISFALRLEELHLTHLLSIQLGFPEFDLLSHLQLCKSLFAFGLCNAHP